ncbi:MAG: hypothetical protein Q9195_007945 [Heterodermia aff. obscurata]
MSDWAEGFAPNPVGTSQGLIGEYGCLLKLCWDEICAAVQKHSRRSPVPELFDTVDKLRQRFRLWINGEDQLDQRLAYASSIRNELIIKLTVLALDLRPGIGLYRSNIQEHLREQTEKCVSQAKALTGFVGPELQEEPSPADIIEFLSPEKCQDLETSINDIFRILPDTIHPFENPEAKEDWQRQISRIDDGIQHFHKKLNILQKLKRKLRELRPTSSGGEKLSRIAKSGSVHTSTSKVKEPDDPEPYERFGRRQRILIEGRSGRVDEPHPAIFDTGCSESLIISSVVKEHDLETRPLPDGQETFMLVDKSEFNTDEYVEFCWKLSQGKVWREGNFKVVDHLPDGLHVLVGSRASEEEDICLRVRPSCLVAFRKKNEDISAQEQRRHTMQTLDGRIRRDQKFKLDQERHAEESKSSETQKMQDPPSQNSVAKNQKYQETKSGK